MLSITTQCELIFQSKASAQPLKLSAHLPENNNALNILNVHGHQPEALSQKPAALLAEDLYSHSQCLFIA